MNEIINIKDYSLKENVKTLSRRNYYKRWSRCYLPIHANNFPTDDPDREDPLAFKFVHAGRSNMVQ